MARGKRKPLSKLKPRAAFQRGVRHGVDLSSRAQQLREQVFIAAVQDLIRVGLQMSNVCYAASREQMRMDAGDRQTMESLDRQWRIAVQTYRARTGQ